MPQLRFQLNFTPATEEKKRFAVAVVRHFSEIMETGTDHIAVAIQCVGPHDLSFGRAGPSGGRVALLDADIRRGRTPEQKRRLALALVEEISRMFTVDPEAVYVVYTEHDGPDFQLSDRVLPAWTPGEEPLGDPGR
jgi:phenylpyruvate tautomerase PptA (4-oxalocrotonate tautomerase family)